MPVRSKKRWWANHCLVSSCTRGAHFETIHTRDSSFSGIDSIAQGAGVARLIEALLR
jgi:hypothetical protein